MKLDRVAGGQVGALVDHDGARLGHGFEPGRGVDDVADDAFTIGPIVELDDGFPGGHRGADDQGEVRLGVVEFVDGLLDSERGAHGSFRIVLVGDRCAKDGKDAVAHQLLDPAAESLDVLAHPGVIGRQPGSHVLGVGPLGMGGETGEVAEDNRDHLAFLGGGGGVLNRRAQVMATGRTELRPGRGLGSTVRARHGERRPALLNRSGRRRRLRFHSWSTTRARSECRWRFRLVAG